MTENKTLEDRQIKDKQIVIDILKELPIIQIACKKSGISRATFYRWRKEDKEFLRHSEDALGQGIEFINDMSESQLIALIKEKKMPAISLWLKNNHKRYGAKIHGYTPVSALNDLTPDEERIVLDALALASGIETQHERNNT